MARIDDSLALMKPPLSHRSSVREVEVPHISRGKQFGAYEVVAPIAEGGMGSVFLARKRGIVGRLFALKVETVETCPVGSRGIENEARIGGRLQHANVIPIVDYVADANGRAALVMDYVPGTTVGRLIRSSNACGAVLPIPVVLRMVYDALLGLAAMHRSRTGPGSTRVVVHRDIAPANLLVGEDGVTRIGDLGVSLCVEDEADRMRAGLEGRIAYMAPERLLGHSDLDPRSDLFALGIVIWEAIAGRRLFCGADDAESRARVLAGDVPSLERFRRDAGLLDGLVACALAPKPDDRFATADTFLDALEAIAPWLGGFATSRVVAATVAAFSEGGATREVGSVDVHPFDSLAPTNVENEPPTALANAPRAARAASA